MSRSGYTDDDDPDENWQFIRWRGAVKSAIRGKRGQALLREMAAALDAMPDKCLIADALEDADGEVCALGAVGKARGMAMENIDPEERDQVAKAFGIAEALAAEIAYMNDDHYYREVTPQERWQRMRLWVADNIAKGESRALLDDAKREMFGDDAGLVDDDMGGK